MGISCHNSHQLDGSNSRHAEYLPLPRTTQCDPHYPLRSTFLITKLRLNIDYGLTRFSLVAMGGALTVRPRIESAEVSFGGGLRWRGGIDTGARAARIFENLLELNLEEEGKPGLIDQWIFLVRR